jgi:hypothetical protein
MKKRIFLVLIGILSATFFIDAKVYAASENKTCTYSTKIGEISLTCPTSGNPQFRYCTIESTKLSDPEAEVSLDGIYGQTIKTDNDEKHTCPEIWIYEKRLGDKKYTIFGETVDVQGMNFALTHETRNLVERAKSPDHIYACTETDYNGYAQKIEGSYQTNLKENYDKLRQELVNANTTPSDTNDATSCENLKKVGNNYSSKFSAEGEYTKKFINEANKILSEIPATCSLTDEQQNNFKELINQKVEWGTSVGKTLGNLGTTNYKKCVEETQLQEEEKDKLMDEADQERKDQNDELEQSKDNFHEDFDRVINISTGINFGDSVADSCEGLLGDELLDIINEIFTWVKIAVPIIVIVLGSIDFGKAVLLNDKDALQKAGITFVKRCIIAVAIFFIPTILNYILEWVDSSTCGIS